MTETEPPTEVVDVVSTGPVEVLPHGLTWKDYLLFVAVGLVAGGVLALLTYGIGLLP